LLACRDGASRRRDAGGVIHRARSTLAGEIVTTSLVVLGMGCAAAISAGLAAAGFLCELDETRPVLSSAAPVIEAAPPPRQARRVILVIIDGLRARDAYDMPALEGLRSAGVTAIATSHYPTWSRPNYVAILTGVPPLASGVRTNHHDAPIALDSLMDRANAGGMSCVLASEYEVLPQMFLRRASDGAYRSPCVAQYAPWADDATETADAVATSDAELAVLLIGSVDRAGHLRGAASRAYRAAAREADRALARVLAGVDLSRDAVIVTADHGHTDEGGHGGVERDVLEVPLVAAGAGIQRGARVEHARLVDIAPTIAALLGLPAPGHGLGRTLVEILALGPEAARDRAAADQARVTAARAVLSDAQTRASSAVTTRSTVRAVVAAAVALLAIATGVVAWRRRQLRLDRRVVATSALAIALSYAAVLACGATSVSSVAALPDQAGFVPTFAGSAALAIAIHLAACGWATRAVRDPLDQLATSNAIAGAALVLALIPAAVVWVGSPSPLVVPEAAWLATVPLVLAGVACTAVVVAVGLARAVFAFLVRAVRTGA
jgi:Metalloenzyme superfamily/Type I phosphodiesterase / nucleotide pyrophosphatase